MPRPRIVVVLLAAAVLLIPIGTYEAYPSRAPAQTLLVHACRVLTPSALDDAAGADVRGRQQLVDRGHSATEAIMPSISRNGCAYTWRPPCRAGASVASVTFAVIAMKDVTEAEARFVYAREILHQGSYARNHFHDFRLDGRRAYEETMGQTVIVRVLDGRFIVDLQPQVCVATSGGRAQATVAPLVKALRLPVAASAFRPRRIPKG